MKPERWQQLDQLFHSALQREPAERPAFLEEVCLGDKSLRLQVEALLVAHEQAGSFIEKPAFEVEARSVADDQGESVVGQTIGHYKILSSLGVGGMGEVYLAEDSNLGRKIALKILPAEFTRDIDRVRRFQQEARAASALNHPNIITIYEIGQLQDRHFMATELIDGETLRGRISRVKSRTAGTSSGTSGSASQFRDILNLAIQAADALAAAHEVGIVHRDIKPENIMVRRRDGYVKVLDFGLAKLTEVPATAPDQPSTSRQIKTSAGVVMGTANYMSPEQARAEKVDARTDIWSLGVVLYELVAGCAPFERSTPGEVIALILEREPPPLARYAREIPPELERIVGKALTKDMEERYQTAKDLLVDLRRLRQRLEVEEGIERSATPGAGSEPAVVTEGTPAAETANESAARTDAEVALPTSSAEYLVTEIKRHKTVVALAALMIAVAVTAFGLYRFMGQRRSGVKPTPAFQTMKITRLTSTGKARYAAISPDGRYVVHVVVEENGQQSLWMRQVAPSSNVQIVPPADFSYAGISFSPDGNYIYYLVAEADYLVLYQRPMLGGAARKLIVDIDSGITFSPDNKQFAFLRGNPGKREVALMLANADGTAERALTVRKHPYSFPDFGAAPAWSPDGTIIVTPAGSADAGGPHMMLVEVSVADGAVKQITQGKWSEVGQTVWLRDGSGLVFSAREQPSSPSQLWHISYPSGEAHRITNDLNDYLGVSLTADSTALVTVQSERSSNIWIASNSEAGSATQITFSNLDGRGGIAWTPDDKIVYASLASGNSDLWIMDADGNNQKQLTFDARNNSPAVSPDGRYIVFISDRSGSAHIWRMEIDGSNPEQLTNGFGEEWPTFTQDGKSVIYASGLDWTLWKVPMGGGGPEQLTHRYLGVIPRISPDGKLIAADDNGRVAIYPFEGGEPIKIFNNLFRFSWAPSGSALEYLDQPNIYSQPLDGSPSKRLTNFKSGLIGWFARSRDGKQLAVSRIESTNDVVLISDFRAQQ